MSTCPGNLLEFPLGYTGNLESKWFSWKFVARLMKRQQRLIIVIINLAPCQLLGNLLLQFNLEIASDQ